MASQAQIESNRINARRSTGPRTAEGKARASRNALQHGLLSEQALLETEDAEAHEEYCAAMREELRPRGPWEEMLAEQVITQGWRLRRAMWMETCLLDHALAPALEEDAKWRRLKWDAARWQAKQEGRDEADVPNPCPRRRPREVGTRFAGAALMRMMYERNYLDVLRRYARAIERGMHEAMRALKAVQRERAEAGTVERGGNGACPPGAALAASCPSPSTDTDIARPAKSQSGVTAAALQGVAAAPAAPRREVPSHLRAADSREAARWPGYRLRAGEVRSYGGDLPLRGLSSLEAAPPTGGGPDCDSKPDCETKPNREQEGAGAGDKPEI